MTVIAGVDLAGVEKNRTGLAKIRIIDSDTSNIIASLVYKKAFTNSDILSFCSDASIVAIDSPLTLPLNENDMARELDKEMTKRGFRVFPALFSGMKKLTFRAIELKEHLLSKGKKVIEVHPKSTLRKLGITHSEILRYLKIHSQNRISKDEMDAIVCALTGLAYFLGEVETIEAEDGILYLPSSSFIEVIPMLQIVNY